MDPATSTWENFGTFTDPETKRTIGSYGINADNNNLYMLDFNAANIGILNGATKKLEILRTAIPNSRPRQEASTTRTAYGSPNTTATPSRCSTRGRSRSRNGLFHSVVEPLRRRHRQERRGMDWIDDERPNLRLDTKTGQFTEYLLPNPTNIRRVGVDNSTSPVTFWVGSNHGASIVKLEPLD